MILKKEEWERMDRDHHLLLDPLITEFRQRRQRRERQPVIDFLFEYYQCNRKWLAEWRPGLGVKLEGDVANRFLEDTRYLRSGGLVFLDSSQIDSNLQNRVTWVCHLLERAKQNPVRLNCFGLHEWAMVYKSDRIRHESTPLRLPMQEIESVVETHPLRCSHFDAFRFFTPNARPLNQLCPSLETRPEYEQYGCIHFNMDLYKWCYKFAPWTSADLTRLCFFHAIQARQIDMQASPYDVQHLGLAPIPIETAAGKKEYQQRQEQLMEEGLVLAECLLQELKSLLV